MKVVCAACFDDKDIASLVESWDGPPGCSFCGQCDAPTAPVDEVASYIRKRMLEFYSLAVNHLMYVSAEGGYLGGAYDTEDLLFWTIGLTLPRDEDQVLSNALLEEIGIDEAWCDRSPGGLEFDQAMMADWNAFCTIVQRERRFFFHEQPLKKGDPLSAVLQQSPRDVLEDIRRTFEMCGFTDTIKSGHVIYRAREQKEHGPYDSAIDLGPPPPEKALMSNRMNPPGIPMFYGADRAELAAAEVAPKGPVTIGRFETTRPIYILDLASFPERPGFFSEASRMEIQGFDFLREFAERISQPVSRDDRSNIEYIPTQVFTEFLRDLELDGIKLDGIRYKSATGQAGANIVLFASQADVEGGIGSAEEGAKPWLRLIDTFTLDTKQ